MRALEVEYLSLSLFVDLCIYRTGLLLYFQGWKHKEMCKHPSLVSTKLNTFQYKDSEQIISRQIMSEKSRLSFCASRSLSW